MKPADVKNNTYIDSNKEVNDQDTIFKIDHITRILKHKNSFAKEYTQNWSEEVFLISMVKKLLEHFMKRNNKITK